jgi:DinB superfamily
MSFAESTAAGLQFNLDMVNGTLSDFSDSEFFARPCPGANHPAWQIGHLTSAETGMVNGLSPGAGATLPEGFGKKFTRETAGKDDPSFFGSKAQLMDLFGKARAATIAWVRTLTPADLAKPSPESMRRMAQTLGDALILIPVHTAMHLGQIQVARRKLGKPLLF